MFSYFQNLISQNPLLWEGWLGGCLHTSKEQLDLFGFTDRVQIYFHMFGPKFLPGNRLGYTLWASQLNPIIISRFILINMDIYWPKLYYRNLSILLLMIHVLSLAWFVFVTHLESMDTRVVYCRSKYSLNLRIMNNYCSHKKLSLIIPSCIFKSYRQ